jgi:hypothetical protein
MQQLSAGVTVSASLPPHMHSAPQVREDSFEVGDDGTYPLGLRLHAQQCLFEIEIEGKRSDKME